MTCSQDRYSIQANFNQSINQSNIIYFAVHKCMLKNLQDYLGNKVVFAQVEIKWNITCGNLDMQQKMLDWDMDNRRHHQQLNR